MRLGAAGQFEQKHKPIEPEDAMKTKSLYVVCNSEGQYWSEHLHSWADYCWAKLYPRKSLANTVADEVGGQACTTRQAIDQIVKRSSTTLN